MPAEGDGVDLKLLGRAGHVRFKAEEELGVLHVKGVEEAVGAAAQNAEVLALAARGMLPVLEAMSCGTPVVSSDVSSIPEICGDAGILVDPYDTDRIADAVKKVLSSIELQTALSQKGLERAKRFSLKNMAAKTLELYRKVARD